MQVGYGNAELAEAGCGALKTLPYYDHFFKTSNSYTAELAAEPASLLPDVHDRVPFANSGSEANDTARKLSRCYWNLKGRPEKKIHISRAIRDTMVLAPPLAIGDAEVEEAMAKLRAAVDRTARDCGKI